MNIRLYYNGRGQDPLRKISDEDFQAELVLGQANVTRENEGMRVKL